MKLSPVVALLLLAAPAVAAGDVHKVPQDHPTIQDAVNAAADGDTILISAGTYDESVLVVSKKNLLIEGKGKVVIDPPSGSGLVLEACDGCTVLKIRVGGGFHGFDLAQCTSCILQQCRSDLAVDAGILVDGGVGVKLVRCIVTGAGGAGIQLGFGAQAADVCLVQRCTLTGCGGDGIAVSGQFNTIDRCTVMKSMGDAFRMDTGSPGTSNTTFQDSKAIQPGGAGLVVNGDGIFFLRCKVDKPGGYGAHVVSGNVSLVHDCRFSKTGLEGVFVTGAATSAAVTGCKVSGSTGDGILVGDDGASVSGNKVSGSKGSGFAIVGDNGTWAGNSATGSQADGFVLIAGSANNHLTGNKAKGSKNFDLDDQSGGANTVDPDNHFKTTSP
jgi:hypothetical protein